MRARDCIRVGRKGFPSPLENGIGKCKICLNAFPCWLLEKPQNKTKTTRVVFVNNEHLSSVQHLSSDPDIRSESEDHDYLGRNKRGGT